MATKVHLASLVTQAADGNLGTMFGAAGISATRATSATSSGLAYSRSISSRVRRRHGAGTARARRGHGAAREVDELERRHNASLAAC